MRRSWWNRQVVARLSIYMLAVLEMEPNRTRGDQEGFIVLPRRDDMSAALKSISRKRAFNCLGKGESAASEPYHFMPMWRWALRFGWNDELDGCDTIICNKKGRIVQKA